MKSIHFHRINTQVNWLPNMIIKIISLKNSMYFKINLVCLSAQSPTTGYPSHMNATWQETSTLNFPMHCSIGTEAPAVRKNVNFSSTTCFLFDLERRDVVYSFNTRCQVRACGRKECDLQADLIDFHHELDGNTCMKQLTS